MKKKFHINDSQKVERCRAFFGKCPFESHFSTFEEAVDVIEKQQRNELNRQNGARLKSIINKNDPNHMVDQAFNLTRRSNYGRKLSHKIEEFQHIHGEKPEFVKGRFNASISNGKDNEIIFKAYKVYDIIENPPRVSPVWVLVTERTDSRGGKSRELSRERIELATRADVRKIKLHANQMLQDSSEEVYGKTEGTKKSSEYLDSFINAFNSVETEEKGSDQAQRLGASFFTGSDADRIVARADYTETSFRADTFKEMLESNSFYKNKNPKATVIVQNSLSKTSPNYWTVIHDDNKWRVILNREDQEQEVLGPFDDPQEFSGTVYDFEIDEMGVEEEQAFKDGQYCYSLYTGINESLASHRRKIENHAKQQ